jgi:hypothetical protein
MIPFFVVDRPISLEIVKSYWSTKPQIKYGVMTHALTTERFRMLFARYPCGDPGICRACGREVGESDALCDKGQKLRRNIIKMGDSGIFAGGERLPYEELFGRYENMNVDYGVMVDYFLDTLRTLESAREAVHVFRARKYHFQLVLVAQGRNTDEYGKSYGELKRLGDYPIAIGGMLRRKINSARYIHLSQEALLDDVLWTIRKTFNPDWLFVLGVYHHKRHELLSKHDVTGTDYKGWIFNYEHRRDLLSRIQAPIREHGIARSGSRLYQLLTRRETLEKQLQRKTLALRGNLQGEVRHLAKQRRKRTLKLIERVDKEILTLTVREYRNNGLSPGDQYHVERAIEILSTSDQVVRFAGVHRYFEAEILPRIVQKTEVSNRSDHG